MGDASADGQQGQTANRFERRGMSFFDDNMRVRMHANVFEGQSGIVLLGDKARVRNATLPSTLAFEPLELSPLKRPAIEAKTQQNQDFVPSGKPFKTGPLAPSAGPPRPARHG